VPGEAIQIGPFTGGLNSFSDPSAIADNELAVCENFELDLDGSLKSRPPFVYKSVDIPLNSAGGSPDILGYFYAAGDVPFLIASDGNSSTYYYDGSWHLITNTVAAAAMVEYNNQAWLIAPAGSTNPGGYWTGPSGSFTAVSAMPKGSTALVYKERIFISGNTAAPEYLYYSNPLGFSPFWPTTPNATAIGTGDGQSIKKIVNYYSSILVFRSNSIYSYSYLSDTAGFVVSQVVPNIGLTNKKTLVVYENYIYFMYDDMAFEFINNRATQINVKTPLISGTRTGIDETQARAVSLFNRRIIFSYFDKLYVYSLRTRTWTVWTTDTYTSIGQILSVVSNDQYESAICFSSKLIANGSGRVAKTLQITDTFTAGESETFNCVVQTKNFNYQSGATYKRLFWWGTDASFKGTVVGTATPITFNQAIPWSSLASSTWTSLASYSWDQPSTPSIAVTTTQSTAGASTIRKFVKFLKGLRFRQINFRVTFVSDGTPDTSPVRLFSLMTYVRSHAHVSKSVS
jgi:hypothetical protein